MHLEISQILNHPIERVWEVLLDPDVLKRALPGIEKLETTAPDTFAVVMNLGVAAVKGRYSGTMSISDKQPPSSYRLQGEGKGAPGWTRGTAVLTLAPERDGTRVTDHGRCSGRWHHRGGRTANDGRHRQEHGT